MRAAAVKGFIVPSRAGLSVTKMQFGAGLNADDYLRFSHLPNSA